MQFTGRYGKIISWCPSPLRRVGAPTSRKSWIRHCHRWLYGFYVSWFPLLSCSINYCSRSWIGLQIGIDDRYFIIDNNISFRFNNFFLLMFILDSNIKWNHVGCRINLPVESEKLFSVNNLHTPTHCSINAQTAGTSILIPEWHFLQNLWWDPLTTSSMACTWSWVWSACPLYSWLSSCSCAGPGTTNPKITTRNRPRK